MVSEECIGHSEGVSVKGNLWNCAEERGILSDDIRRRKKKKLGRKSKIDAINWCKWLAESGQRWCEERRINCALWFTRFIVAREVVASCLCGVRKTPSELVVVVEQRATKWEDARKWPSTSHKDLPTKNSHQSCLVRSLLVTSFASIWRLVRVLCTLFHLPYRFNRISPNKTSWQDAEGNTKGVEELGHRESHKLTRVEWLLCLSCFPIPQHLPLEWAQDGGWWAQKGHFGWPKVPRKVKIKTKSQKKAQKFSFLGPSVLSEVKLPGKFSKCPIYCCSIS